MLNKSLRVVLFPFRRRGLLEVSNAQKTTHMIFGEIDLILERQIFNVTRCLSKIMMPNSIK